MTEPNPIDVLAEAAREYLAQNLAGARELGKGLFTLSIYHPDGVRNVDVTGYLNSEDFTLENLWNAVSPGIEALAVKAQQWADEDRGSIEEPPRE